MKVKKLFDFIYIKYILKNKVFEVLSKKFGLKISINYEIEVIGVFI
jgi:hypothetical protein